MAYFAIALSVLLTVTGQLLIKWRTSIIGEFSGNASDRIHFFASVLSDLWIWLGLACAFGAFLAWIVALSHLDLSYAYPFMASTYVLVLASSYFLLGEPAGFFKVIGVIIIMAGIAVSSFSQ